MQQGNRSANDTQRYYNAYWDSHAQQLNGHEILRLAEILKGVACVLEATGNTPLRICDLGCGRGWLSNELAKFGSVVGVDLSDKAVVAAKDRWPHVDFRAADITSWRPDETFDLVVSSEVIEHIPDQKAFASTVRHLLRNGGYLILTTPNGKVKKAWDHDGQEKQLIEQWLSPGQLRSLFPVMKPIFHHTFLYDFSYQGIHRIISAPALLRLIVHLGAKTCYDAIRDSMSFGLYQIVAGHYEKVT